MSDTEPTAEELTLPNGKKAHTITCPHCGEDSLVEFPSTDHIGEIKAECGKCGTVEDPKAFTYTSPHGSADEVVAAATAVVDGEEVHQVNVSDGGTAVG